MQLPFDEPDPRRRLYDDVDRELTVVGIHGGGRWWSHGFPDFHRGVLGVRAHERWKGGPKKLREPDGGFDLTQRAKDIPRHRIVRVRAVEQPALARARAREDGIMTVD